MLVCGDYLSPVEIPMLSDGGSRDAYLATLERLRPLVEQADWVVPGHGAPIDGARALAILREDVAYLTDWELPLARRTARSGRSTPRTASASERPEAGEAEPRGRGDLGEHHDPGQRVRVDLEVRVAERAPVRRDVAGEHAERAPRPDDRGPQRRRAGGGAPRAPA